MNIFLTQTHRSSAVWITFIIDGCNLIDFKKETAIHCHYKAWKSQKLFFNNLDCIRLKEERHIHLG